MECPFCGGENPSNALTCFNCGYRMVKPDEPPTVVPVSTEPPPAPAPSGDKVAMTVIAVLALALATSVGVHLGRQAQTDRERIELSAQMERTRAEMATVQERAEAFALAQQRERAFTLEQQEQEKEARRRQQASEATETALSPEVAPETSSPPEPSSEPSPLVPLPLPNIAADTPLERGETVARVGAMRATLPPGWAFSRREKNAFGGFHRVYRSPDKLTVVLLGYVENGDTWLERWAAYNRRQIARGNRSVLMDVHAGVLLDGQENLRIEYTETNDTDAQKKPQRHFERALVYQGHGYYTLTIVPPSRYAEMSAAVEGIRASIQFDTSAQ